MKKSIHGIAAQEHGSTGPPDSCSSARRLALINTPKNWFEMKHKYYKIIPYIYYLIILVLLALIMFG
jgi:hypothetical protein